MRSLVAASALAAAAFLAPAPSTHTPVERHAARRELIAVFIGSVGTNESSGLRAALPEMKASLAGVASASGRRFVSRGVSLEPLVDDGVRDLAALGGFDEISVGGNWTNSAVVHYLWQDPAGHVTIPQVVVLERERNLSMRMRHSRV